MESPRNLRGGPWVWFPQMRVEKKTVFPWEDDTLHDKEQFQNLSVPLRLELGVVVLECVYTPETK